MIMQLALRPFVAATGVVVVGAGLIQVTPVTAPHIEQRAVHLAAAAESLSDLVGATDAVVSSLGGLSGELSNALPSLGDVSGTLADGAASQAALDLLDPAFWQLFFYDLSNPDSGDAAWLLLTGAVEQLPVVGPLLWSFGGVVVLPVSLLLAYGWSLISEALGLQPYAAAAAEGLGTGLQRVYDAALSGVIDPALPAGVTTFLGDITPLLSDAAGVLEPTTMVQDLATALDPSVLASGLDLNPIADIGTVVDPGGLVEIGTLVDTSPISDIGGLLASLIP
jgi:hypothetical protein